MYKTYIFCGLLILFTSCGSNSTETEEIIQEENITEPVEENTRENVESPAEETTDAPVEEVAEEPAVVRNCGAAEFHAYLNDPDDSGTNIRKSPGGEVVLVLVTDDLNFEYFFTLTESQNGWFKVKSPIGGMENDFEIPGQQGWIHGSVISVDTRNYGGEKLELLDKPEDGKIVAVIEEESGLTVKDMCGKWVLVEYNGITGWIESYWLCGNPLTTCS